MLVEHLTSSADLCLRAADLLRMEPVLLNLGGGFGVAYKQGQASLDLALVGEAINKVLRRVRPAKVALELGRYLVAEAGWYVTTIVGQQAWNGRQAVVVDGGTHQRGDFCGLRLRSEGDSPILLEPRTGSEQRISVLGCLCSPDDVLAEAALLPSDLAMGDVLAFPNAGAYGLSASPTSFLAHPLPAEIAFDGERMVVLRQGNGPDEVLRGQASWRCVETSCRDN
jgi:diaminopimelate decarboxylase